MKRLLFLLVACLSLAGLSLPSSAAPVDETVITYQTFKGHPVQFVIDGQSRYVILRVMFHGMFASEGAPSLDEEAGALDFLKSEVVRFAYAGKPVPLGTTGFSFLFVGGHPPIWGPYSAYWREGSYKGLAFAINPKVTRRAITASGEKWEGRYVLPYLDEKKRP